MRRFDCLCLFVSVLIERIEAQTNRLILINNCNHIANNNNNNNNNNILCVWNAAIELNSMPTLTFNNKHNK